VIPLIVLSLIVGYVVIAFIVEDFFTTWWQGKRSIADVDVMGLFWFITVPIYLVWCFVGVIVDTFITDRLPKSFRIGSALATLLKREKADDN
jgi:hypothetical protein